MTDVAIARQEAARAWARSGKALRFLGYERHDLEQDIQLDWLRLKCGIDPALRRTAARRTCMRLLERAFRKCRELGQAPRVEEPDPEEWIFPGFGRENLFYILRSGDYQGNVRFEYDPASRVDGSGESQGHLYID